MNKQRNNLKKLGDAKQNRSEIMTILIDKKTRVVVQGITGHQGRIHTEQMKLFGTNVVAGTSPGKAGENVLGVPVFDSVIEAVEETKSNTSVIFVPAPFAKDACFEAIDAGIKVIVAITEHIPFHDTMEVVHYSKLMDAVVIGPNCPGVVSPGKSKVGILPNQIFKEGNIGVVSRSGTLTYEIVYNLTERGLGQSTCVGLGGDPIIGTTFIEALKMFEADKETDTVVLVGEIGGTAEEDAAKYIEQMKKPVYAYIAGRSAPKGKKMGHAGAIIARGKGTAENKIKALNDVGVKVARNPSEVPDLILEDKK